MSQTNTSRETILQAIERIRAKGAATMVIPPALPVLVLRRASRQAERQIGGIRTL